MAPATTIPNIPSAQVYNLPAFTNNLKAVDYLFSNKVSQDRIIISVDNAGVKLAQELLQHILILTKPNGALSAVLNDYSVAKEALPTSISILNSSTMAVEMLEQLVMANNATLDANSEQFITTMKQVQQESHFAVETLTLFKNLHNVNKLGGKVYTAAKLKAKYAHAV
jgi:hypothetical protein